MYINEVLKSNGEINKFYCEELDIYLRLTNLDGRKSLCVSDTLDNIDDIDCPLLENVMCLEDIFDLEVEPCYIYSINDILRVDNKSKYFKMLGYDEMIHVELTRENIPEAYIIGYDGERENLIDDIYTLNAIINAKFVEVN